MVVFKNVYVGVFDLPTNIKKIWTGMYDDKYSVQIVTDDSTEMEHFETAQDAVKKYPFFTELNQWFDVRI